MGTAPSFGDRAGVAAACSNSSDPVGNVASGPATGDAAKIEAVDGACFTPATRELPRVP